MPAVSSTTVAIAIGQQDDLTVRVGNPQDFVRPSSTEIVSSGLPHWPGSQECRPSPATSWDARPAARGPAVESRCTPVRPAGPPRAADRCRASGSEVEARSGVTRPAVFGSKVSGPARAWRGRLIAGRASAGGPAPGQRRMAVELTEEEQPDGDADGEVSR